MRIIFTVRQRSGQITVYFVIIITLFVRYNVFYRCDINNLFLELALAHEKRLLQELLPPHILLTMNNEEYK